ncbi:MAG: ATP-binding protein [Bacteroidota bacterium]|nr:ATP-binding protein [Bacteroidota bacterium]
MINEIIGREREINIFNKLIASDSPSFLAIYGRRRVGKTFLIRKHFKTHIQFSFTGSFEEKNQTQLDNFFREYLYRTKGKKETTSPQNWSIAFSYLADYLYSLKNHKKKVVIFIDELPWIDRPKSGFIPALEYFWNQHLSSMNNVALIVCGSAASWMQKKLIKAKGGLYNRITHRIKLEPFTLHETELFIKTRKLKLTKYQIIQLYMVMGGIPFYLNELSQGKSAEQLIDEICFTSTGLLSNEYEQLYYSLFTNAEKHMTIIEALATAPNGMTRTSILKKTKLQDGGTFNRTINDLYESGFVVKQLSFNNKKKDALYKIIDFYSLFYLKFIKNNVADTTFTWQKLANLNSYKVWCGYAYENVCMLHTKQILKKLGLSGTFTQISSWRHKGNEETKGAQIDMLIDRKDGVVNLCEVKFTGKEFVISKKYNTELRQKRSIFEHVTSTKKSVVTTLITTYAAIQNKYYSEEIHSEVTMDDLFVE